MKPFLFIVAVCVVAAVLGYNSHDKSPAEVDQEYRHMQRENQQAETDRRSAEWDKAIAEAKQDPANNR
jgi:hypothetical protein